MNSFVYYVAGIMVGADVVSIYPRPLDEAPWRQMQFMQWPIEHGMGAQWLRLVNESEVKKRTEAAYAGAGAVKTRVFAEAVKAGIPEDAGAELQSWLGRLTDSPKRLMDEAQMRVFGWDRESERLALVREITQKVLEGKDDRMKPVAVWVLALANIRDGEPKAAIECLDRFNSMKGNTEDERLCQLVRCLANAMRDSEMAAPEAIAAAS